MQKKKTNGNNVYVTGMGVLTSSARNIEEFSSDLIHGKSGIGILKGKIVNGRDAVGAELDVEMVRNNLRIHIENAALPEDTIQKIKKCSHRASKSIKASLSCVAEAYMQAELFRQPVPKERIGLIVAGSNLTYKIREEYLSSYLNGFEYLSPYYALRFLDTDHVGVISEIYDIGGEGFTIGGASASGNLAIIKAHQLLQLGIVDVCVISGAVAELTSMELQGFYNIGALGGRKYADFPELASRPFDRGHEGFILGEASGCIILESEASVVSRNVIPLVKLLGGKNSLDGNRSSNPSLDGEINMMRALLKEHSLKPDDISYINAHGSSSPLGDETELRAIKNIFKSNFSSLWINSTKSLTGHCLYSAGIVEAIATIIQMNKGFVHPAKNLESPILEGFLFSSKTSALVDMKYTLSNSFGFGGINSSVLFKNL